jgi:dienelactone hydrolase
MSLPVLTAWLIVAHAALISRAGEPLAGTAELTMEGDIASELVSGVDRFLLRQIDLAADKRQVAWQIGLTDKKTADEFRWTKRAELAHVLGVRDPRVESVRPTLLGTPRQPALVGRGEGFEVFAVRWPVLADPDPNRDQAVVHGEGLLLVPTDRKLLADVVALPHCDHTPEQLAGLTPGLPAASQFARLLAQSGCRVVVPTLISRDRSRRTVPGRGPGANLTNREFIYRPAFELGRHLIGYEVQKVLAAVDWFDIDAERPVGVIGHGEGGRIALYAAALDTRIDAAYVSGAFGPRERVWQEPIDRNVFGLVRDFGDAEVASLIADRTLIVDDAALPKQEFPGEGGAPAVLVSPTKDEVAGELARAVQVLGKVPPGDHKLTFVTAGGKPSPPADALAGFLNALAPDAEPRFVETPPERLAELADVADRQERQVDELDLFNQLLLRESPYVRESFFKDLDTTSLDTYRRSIERYRDIFREDVIGHYDRPLLEPKPRTRRTWRTEKWTGYEVVLDVFPDVIAYGALLVPNDIPEGERRPAVVCQHGLEGRPTDTFLGDHRAYHDFAGKLAERGFVVFAPQNLYLFGDRFRTLQRKANLTGHTLFSVIVPQHRQIIRWLASLPQVDGERIGFYGLSYGGKSAMRIPALVTEYALSICSADFNEWVWKNASTRATHSYVWTGEYEIFEWDLGSTFNYAEMAALIAPRPFMVERGHFDGVAPDEKVGHEFAKVRRLYNARLGIGERCRIEWFAGPHTINGQGTFDFLHEHLDWPRPDADRAAAQ